MILCNLHTHTIYCDGQNTAEQMVKAAVEKGFTTLGFSAHSFTPFEKVGCLCHEADYIKEITRLKEKYANVIDVKIGVELDYYSSFNLLSYDYFIGSVHYIKRKNKYYSVDGGIMRFEDCLNNAFNGDTAAMVKKYYSLVADMVISRRPDIVGHLDVITKYNLNNAYFDAESPWYLSVVETALKRIKASGYDGVFEINLNGIYRKYRLTPYPDWNIISLLNKYDFKVTLSSDAHCVEALGLNFENTYERLVEMGYKKIVLNPFADNN